MSTTPSLELYQFSGAVGKSPLFLLVMALPLCLLWSAGYAYLDVYLPIGGVLTLFMVGGYAFLLGVTISLVGKFGKSRNPTQLKLMGLGIGAISLYAAWALFLHALFARTDADAPSILEFARDPQMMWSGITSVNESGWYTIKGTTPSGIILWIFWAIEAAVVLGAPWLLAGSGIDNEMFCEACDQWCPAGDMTYHEPTPALMAVTVNLISPIQLLALPKLAEKNIPAFRAEMLQCPGCKRAGVRFSRLRHEKSDKGELVEKTDTIPGILLPPGQAAM